MDFNAILAKANKNAQNAQKILKIREEEKKKTVIQKQQAAGTTSRSANVADEVRKKAEEAKLRAEQETRELLEQRRKKFEAQQKKADAAKPQSSSKKPVNSVKTDSINVTNNKKPNETFKKPAVPNGNSSKINGSVKTSPKPIKNSVQSKPALSYNDILRLADEMHKGTGKPTTTTTTTTTTNGQNKMPTKTVATTSSARSASAHATSMTSRNAKPAVFKKPGDPAPSAKLVKSKSNTDLTGQKSNKPAPQQYQPQQQGGKRFLPGDIRGRGSSGSTQSLKTNNQSSTLKSTTQQKPTNSQTTSKPKLPQQQQPTSHKDKQPVTSTSSWDRIMSDIKKKQPVNKHTNDVTRKRQSQPDYNDDFNDDEDEYDSEMDDFIDDGEDEPEDYSTEIRKIFKYDPKRYKHIDDSDLASMESSYHEILKEERQSAKIGYLEDLEDMRLEEEEKKRKQIKTAKKQRTD